MLSTRWLALAGAAMVGAACFDEPAAPAEPVDATGRWEAFVDGAMLDLQLVERQDLTIVGVGHIRPRIVRFFGGAGGVGPVPDHQLHPAPAATAPSVALRADGIVLWPRVSLSLRSFGFEDINFTGRWIGPHSIRGQLWGSGFEGHRASLRRRDLRVDTTAVLGAFGEDEDRD